MISDFSIIFEAASEGGYTAYIQKVPGAISEGETLDEAREMVMSALQEVIEVRTELGLKIDTDGASFDGHCISD